MAETAYASPEQAVEALRPGWKIVGRAPYEVETVNPARTVPGPDGKIDPLAPATIKSTIGTILSVEGPNGEPDRITVSNLKTLPNDVTGGAKGGVGYTVITGPTKGPSATDKKASDPSKWTNVTRPGTTDVIALWDPVNNDFHPIAAPPDAKPTGKYDPVVVTDADGKQRQVGMVDTGDKSFHPLAAPPQAQPSGKYENIEVTNADGSKRVVGMVDTGDKSFHPLAADPTTGRQIVTTPDKIFVFDNQGNVTNTVDIKKNSPYQAVVIDGVPYQFDPNEKDPTKAFTKAPGDWQHPPIKDKDGNPMQWVPSADGGGSYEYPPGVKPGGALQTNTTAKTLDWYDNEGNLIKSVENKNYVPPQNQTTAPATNLVAPKILIPDPDHPGQLKWIDNESRVTASQALQNIASQLSGHVVDGNISVDEAKAIIDGANAAMTTQTQAAQAAIQGISQGAQTGANILNQRVQAAQNFVQQGMGLLGQTKHGLLVAPPSDFGANLVQGAAGYATELGGGPEVYAAAANLVRRADPNGAQGQDAAAAYATLTQMFQKYRQTHGGQPSPEEVQASQGAGPGAAAATQQATQQAFASPPQAAPWQRADQMGPNPTTPQGNALAAAGMAGTVAPGSPNYLGFKAPFAQSGLPEGRSMSVAAAPFVAPPIAPDLQTSAMPMINAGAPITPSNRNITITVPTG